MNPLRLQRETIFSILEMTGAVLAGWSDMGSSV